MRQTAFCLKNHYQTSALSEILPVQTPHGFVERGDFGFKAKVLSFGDAGAVLTIVELPMTAVVLNGVDRHLSCNAHRKFAAAETL